MGNFFQNNREKIAHPLFALYVIIILNNLNAVIRIYRMRRQGDK